MLIQKPIIKLILLVLLLSMLAALFILGYKALFENKEKWMKFNPYLQPGEVIIDGVLEDTRGYFIISSEGRKDYGDLFVVFEQAASLWRRSYQNNFINLKPWKIELSDIDGDGTKEILTAVRKTTHFDKTEKNRLFIFNYKGKKLVKKWTGSQIAGNWREFYTGDLLPIKGNEIIFIEQAEGGCDKVSIYYWFDFGFLKLAESEPYKDIVSLSIIDENRIQITYNKKHKQSSVLTVKNGKIVETVSEE